MASNDPLKSVRAIVFWGVDNERREFVLHRVYKYRNVDVRGNRELQFAQKMQALFDHLHHINFYFRDGKLYKQYRP